MSDFLDPNVDQIQQWRFTQTIIITLLVYLIVSMIKRMSLNYILNYLTSLTACFYDYRGYYWITLIIITLLVYLLVSIIRRILLINIHWSDKNSWGSITFVEHYTFKQVGVPAKLLFPWVFKHAMMFTCWYINTILNRWLKFTFYNDDSHCAMLLQST